MIGMVSAAQYVESSKSQNGHGDQRKLPRPASSFIELGTGLPTVLDDGYRLLKAENETSLRRSSRRAFHLSLGESTANAVFIFHPGLMNTVLPFLPKRVNGRGVPLGMGKDYCLFCKLGAGSGRNHMRLPMFAPGQLDTAGHPSRLETLVPYIYVGFEGEALRVAGAGRSCSSCGPYRRDGRCGCCTAAGGRGSGHDGQAPVFPVFPVFPCLPSRVEHSTSPPLSYLDDISLSGARNPRPQVSREEREHRGYRLDLLRSERGFPLAHRHLSSHPLPPTAAACASLATSGACIYLVSWSKSGDTVASSIGRLSRQDHQGRGEKRGSRVNTLAAQGCVGWTWGSEVVGNRARLFHTGLWFPGE